MSTPVLFVLYFVFASILVFFSIKCADYVDLLDKKTTLSGAFIGGVILAAVTSLPELVTSISSVYVVHNAELIVGNILGSNVFNLCIFGGLTLVTVKGYARASVGRSHLLTLLCTLVAYMATAAALFFDFFYIPGVHINVMSLLILIVYVLSFRFLAQDDTENEEEPDSRLTVRQIVVRFLLTAFGLIVMSVIVTWLTDQLSEQLNLSASLAGALFLGVATSLPELSSSIALVRRRNYNAMVGNVIGSNMFNFTIFSVADIIAGSTSGFVYSSQAGYMLLFGTASTLLVITSLCVKRLVKTDSRGAYVLYAVCGGLILSSYVLFLILSSI
ncbi:MAG: sodium:calcium antiporter [Clostridia bacterium]|nr:sodium:calcium antiporter [Clostridia bacterium]